MEARPTVHPSADVLKAFGLGKLDDTSAGVVMNHLNQCADCCKIVAAQSGDDFLDRLRHGHGRDSTVPPANALSESVADLKPPQPKSPSSQTAIPNLPPELAANPQYDILRELGRGGMGVVYLAKNKLMDRLEVLKVVNKALLERPGTAERFLREIRSAAKLGHANVVAAYSAVQVGDLLAFAMEYVEGQDLTAVVKAQGPLPVANACYYVQQAALGLQHAFEKNMVHRDIKPQNLILAREGKKHIVKVLDFGLAKVMREKAEDTGLTGDGKMLGTPDYIAPEQTLDAASADIRADIYSLGCTLYYLLAGHPPFSAASLGAILLAHQTHEAKLLNVVRSEVPEELAAVVRKMMAKERAKRYQTPLEVAQALAVFVKPGVKGGTTPKSSPDLSLGTPKMAGVKVAKADGPAAPPAASAKPTPPEREATGDDAWSTSVMERGIASRPPRRSAAVPKRRPPAVRRASRKKWWIGGMTAAVLLLVLLGLWASGVFKVKTKDGTIVLENLPANAEVVVDGKTVTLNASDGKPVEIRVAAGKKHQLEVKKDGLKVYGEEIEIDTGGRKSVLVRLEPDKPTVEAALPSAFKNNLGMEFVLVPKGKSWLGGGYSKFGDKEVEIARDFYVGKYAVTQEEWEKVMDKNPSHFSRGGGAKDRVKDIPDDELKRFPVEMVSWADCQVFISQLNERVKEDGWVYRLPTEVEWEYACRGGPMADRRDSAFDFYFDKPANQLSPDQANFAPKAGTGLQRTCKVGTYKPNRLGLYDMHGNVWQWCAWEPPAEPKDAKAALLRVVRGGSCVAGWDGTACCRAAFRLPPVGVSHRDRDVGLRLARVPVGQESKQNTQAPRNGAPPRDVIPPTTERAVAEWVVSRAGTIEVRVNGEVKKIDAVGNLPAESFQLLAINLASKQVGDTGLERFKGLTNLKRLILWNAQISDAGLAHLQDLTNLEELGLFSNAGVTDAGLVHLQRLTNLRNLDLNSTKVTDDGLVHLKGLTKLTSLNLMCTRISGAGLVHLEGLTNLTWIGLAFSTVGDSGMAHLGSLSNLTILGLENTRISDAGLVQLKGLKRLRQLGLSGTKVTPAGVADLQKALPACRIHADAVVAPDTKGFVSLFNGKDLTGWKTHPKQPGNWRVLQGTGGGVLTGSGPAASYLYTERGDYKDFHLRVEARINDGGNSGVYCRSTFGPQIPANNPWFPLSYEAQINSTHRDVNKTGSLYVGGEGAVVGIREAPVPADKWFTMEVITKGNHIVIQVNGKTTADYTDDKHRFTSGHIALQQHNPETVAEFRKIEIKELLAAKSETPAAANAEPAKSPPRGGESALPPEAKTAAKAFEKSCADAREKLLAEFDTALERLAKSKGSTEQRLKLIDAVKAEKRRFENRGWIPWSEPMRPFVAKYFASLSDAESKVRRAYNALIDAQLRAKNENMVADLRADLGNLLSVRVLARWRHFGDGKPQGNHSLYSNGRIDNINGKATWIYAKGVLIYRWPGANAPGGAWIDTLNVSTDGTTYVGTNNFPPGRRPKITGVYLKDD